MTVEPRCWGGVSHPLQLTTGLVINSSVTTSPTLAGEHMLLIPKVSILSEQLKVAELETIVGGGLCPTSAVPLVSEKNVSYWV